MRVARGNVWILFLFLVNSFASGENVSFNHVIVDQAGPKDPWTKILADLDGDGYLDVVIGGRKGPLVWYRFPDWRQFPVVTGGYQTVDGEAGDVDGDGDLDLVLGGLFWYENPGTKGDFDQAWVTHRIREHGTHDVELFDIDSDSDLDIVTRDQSAFADPRGNEIHIWRQETPDSWNHTVIPCRHGEGLCVVDLDQDGDGDIIINGFWFENGGSGTERGEWVEHWITDSHHSASIATGDLNGDGKKDIVIAPAELRGETFRICWYEAVDPGRNSWIEHLIESNVETVYHSLQVGDIDGDGSLDVITAEMHQGADPDEISIYLSQARGDSWRKLVIAETGSHSLQIGDIDGDGKIDLMGANWSGPFQPIELWFNQAE